MKSCGMLLLTLSTLILSGLLVHAEVLTVTERIDPEEATRAFRFKNVPAPSRNDPASTAKFSLVDGRRDQNGGDLDKLRDGGVPGNEDDPSANFFFAAGTDGGRIVIDLAKATEIKQVRTYSWHPGARGPQVYQLYGSTGSAADFLDQPRKGTEPEKCGWELVAKVDTRPKQGDLGGQYGVAISKRDGALGSFRYLLFDISRTEAEDGFGNTFYSEIDVIGLDTPEPVKDLASEPQPERMVVETGDGRYKLTLDTTEARDLTEWSRENLVPMIKEWYPRIVAMLPSEGYEAPAAVSIRFRETSGVAATGGSRITCSAGWFRDNLKGEAVGAVFHELVHVVQNYGIARRTTPRPNRAPGWLVEGIADYLRWFKYEPQSKGAEITKRNLARAKYDGNYRISANFLNWVSEKHDKEIVTKLNAAIRQGKYDEALWKQYTGHTVQELGDAWKAEMEKKVASEG